MPGFGWNKKLLRMFTKLGLADYMSAELAAFRSIRQVSRVNQAALNPVVFTDKVSRFYLYFRFPIPVSLVPEALGK
jgi:hypothetical protein